MESNALQSVDQIIMVHNNAPRQETGQSMLLNYYLVTVGWFSCNGDSIQQWQLAAFDAVERQSIGSSILIYNSSSRTFD